MLCCDLSKIVLHIKTDFDVDLRWLSSRTGIISWKPLIALLHRPDGSIYWLIEITFKSRSCPPSVYEGTTIVIISGMNFCISNSCPLDTPRNTIWWLILKPYLHCEISNGIYIYRGHNSRNRPNPILVNMCISVNFT